MLLLSQSFRFFLIVVTVPIILFGAPPYMWYATYSIEDYDANGDCGRENLWAAHDDADGFSSAVQQYNFPNTWYRYNRRDTQCTAARWSGADAEINNVDFLFYAGHGCSTGPVLGCNSGYPITCWNDISFGGNGFLKWVQGACCSWFTPQEYDNCNSNMDPIPRWWPCFKGVHSVMGHRATTWDHEYSDEMTLEFWKQWYEYSMPIFWAWRQSQVKWVYMESGLPGVEPAIAAANDDYRMEYFSNAQDTPAPDGLGSLTWSTVGTPLY